MIYINQSASRSRSSRTRGAEKAFPGLLVLAADASTGLLLVEDTDQVGVNLISLLDRKPLLYASLTWLV